MRIGIDISQLAYEKTGVANYLKKLVENLLLKHPEHEYVLFFASLRKKLPPSNVWAEGGELLEEKLPKGSNITVSKHTFPPSFLDVLWNKIHILPIENFIGPVDIFLTSDWTEPPAKKAKKATILYDLIVYKYPEETAKKIVAVQKRKLGWVKKESSKVFCISEATKKDAMEILGIPEKNLSVIYPGL